MIKLGLYLLTALFLILGCVAFLSPIPGGIIVLLIGIALLVSVSTTAQKLLRHARTRNHSLNRHFHHLEQRLENRLHFLSLALNATRPVVREIEDRLD